MDGGRRDLEGVELNVTIKVEGVKETRKALRTFSDEAARDLKNNLEGAVETSVLPEIKSRVRADIGRATKKPSRSTGRVLGTIKAQAAGNAVFIIGGTARVAYYGWLDFGGDLKPVGRRRNRQRRPYLKHGRFIYPSIDAKNDALTRSAVDAVESARKKAGLSA